MNRTTLEIGLSRLPKAGYTNRATECHNPDGR
jgi:hypothetical protein